MNNLDSLLVARTPLRISLGGGGTDLPFYRSRFGGDVLSIAISPQVTVIGRKGRLDGKTKFGHDALSISNDSLGVTNPFVREAMRLTSFNQPSEVYSLGAVPAGTGLGSSGAFAVGLLGVLNAMNGKSIDRTSLIEQACVLETDVLNRPVGKHDQYICGLGGLRRLVIATDGSVTVEPTRITPDTIAEVVSRLVLIYTGVRRDAAVAVPKGDTAIDLKARIDQLHGIRDVGNRIRHALEIGDWPEMPSLIREHWSIKSRNAPQDGWSNLFLKAQALGGQAWKLVGAGNGGFILLWVEPDRRAKLLSEFQSMGMPNLPFEQSQLGATLTQIDSNSVEIPL